MLIAGPGRCEIGRHGRRRTSRSRRARERPSAASLRSLASPSATRPQTPITTTRTASQRDYTEADQEHAATLLPPGSRFLGDRAAAMLRGTTERAAGVRENTYVPSRPPDENPAGDAQDPERHSGPLGETELDLIDAYWRAANYLSVGQIYLLDNPLLREPLAPEHVKPRLLGHWGTTPGLNFVYAHLNRVIRARDLSVLYVTGPGHGGPGLVANVYLEGTYSEVYPHIGRDEAGLRALFRQFSFPGGIPSHVAPETPGLDPRGRRARLLARARLRRGVRQPGPARLLRRRRRRGRDRPAGDELALEQVPRPRARRRGAADPAPQRLQDRQPDRAGAHPAAGAARAARGLRLRAAVRRGRPTRARCTS